MNKTFIIACFVCICPFLVDAQDISGFWKGSFNMDGGCFAVNNIELQITLKGDSIFGSSYHYYDIDNYVKKKFAGLYTAKNGIFSLQEWLVTTFKIPARCKVCLKNYQLKYSSSANQESLIGDWNSVVKGSYLDCGIGLIKLARIKESAFKEIPEIVVDTGTIRLDFYDNGEIDDDSISVKVNDQTVLTHQRLGTEPVTTFIKVSTTNTFQEVEMIAENLGSIPPNTALLIITAGKKRYELFLTSSSQKSAKVRFLYEGN